MQQCCLVVQLAAPDCGSKASVQTSRGTLGSGKESKMCSVMSCLIALKEMIKVGLAPSLPLGCEWSHNVSATFPEGLTEVDHSNKGSKFHDNLGEIQIKKRFDLVWIWKDTSGGDDVAQPRCL